MSGARKRLRAEGESNLEIEQSKEIDGAELPIPGRRGADARADGQIGLEQLGNLGERSASEESWGAGDGCACAPSCSVGQAYAAVGSVSNSGETR